MSEKRRRAMRNKARGKANQARMAKMLGVMNVGTIMDTDGLGEHFACEFKSRKKSAVHKFMEQAIKNCPADRIPLVMLHLYGTRSGNDLIMFRYRDWEKVCHPGKYCAPRSFEPVMEVKRRRKK